jgi:P4 family phage/plasmid primase-like protien
MTDSSTGPSPLDAALSYLRAGRSVLPIAPGSKKPSVINQTTGEIVDLAWKPYQSRLPTEAQVRTWFPTDTLMGLGIACGPVSGVTHEGIRYALEILDVDDEPTLGAFIEGANWQGLTELLARLLHQRTPGGAGHFAYLCTLVHGNTVLAKRSGDLDAGEPRAVTLIETRGSGGQAVVAPTPPGIHPDCPERGYELVRGSWEALPLITPDERQALFDLARSFNRYIDPQQVHSPRGTTHPSSSGDRPGDHLNQTADLDWWRALLERHGWTRVHQRGDIVYWQRPGKEGRDWSATLGACGPYFFVFSSNAAPFEPEHAYPPFSAYALLEHGGDFLAAARALATMLQRQNGQAPLGTPGPDTPARGGEATAEKPLPYSDYTNALAFVREHGHDLRYCYPWKIWLVWTGTHWEHDTNGVVMRYTKQTIRRLARHAEDLVDDTAVKALMAHVKASLATAKLKAMVESAQSEPGIPVQPEELDADRWLLNCKNGTLDLRTGELRPHDRTDLLTQDIPVAYDSTAQCPIWDAFLNRIMAGNQNVISFLQRAMGYALTGVIREHVLLILWGKGRNGKSTFLNTLRALLGPYALKAPSELLLVSNHDRHPTERADLFGKRFVAAIETEQGRRLAEVFVKEATGGDPIRARRMREDFWEFWPTHKVFLATNHKPVIKGTDNAIWERIRLVEFKVVIPKNERDTTLPDKLQAELPGILRWAVSGCLDWQRDGLGEPDEVQKATAGYRTEMDVLGQFITECCLVGPNYRIKAADLYDAYKRWCEQNREHADVQRTWGMALTERGYESYKVQGRSWWRGIAIIPEGWVDEQVDEVDEGRRKNGIHSSPKPHEETNPVSSSTSSTSSTSTEYEEGIL